MSSGPIVGRPRPSVEVLLNSVARYAGKDAVAIMLTGMGSDGANAMLNVRNAGATTIAQDEYSSFVFGLPREAIDRGAIDFIEPLDHITQRVLRSV
ncbi:MAG: chemotaxis protein CheB [Candidatus Latescibacterota bacterium]|nr:chemotaxis protein CheB [Candidatus Latescibacterota bacterium]